jgi:RNA polymerase sigma-70 factor (ECF subfamily)
MRADEREAEWAAAMRGAIAGDAVAYQRLLTALGGWLRSRVRARLAQSGCPDLDAEEAVQETLLAIHLKRHTWRPDEPITPWVAAIARNKLVDQLRRRRRRAEVPLDGFLEEELGSAPAEESGTGQDIERVLGSLNERQREIVRLVALEGHSAREAAGQLGMSEGALRVALHRCLRGLASKLREDRP